MEFRVKREKLALFALKVYRIPRRFIMFLCQMGLFRQRRKIWRIFRLFMCKILIALLLEFSLVALTQRFMLRQLSSTLRLLPITTLPMKRQA